MLMPKILFNGAVRACFTGITHLIHYSEIVRAKSRTTPGLVTGLEKINTVLSLLSLECQDDILRVQN